MAGVARQPLQAFDANVLGDIVIRPVAHRFDGDFLELLDGREDDDLDGRVVLLGDLQQVEAAGMPGSRTSAIRRSTASFSMIWSAASPPPARRIR